MTSFGRSSRLQAALGAVLPLSCLLLASCGHRHPDSKEQTGGAAASSHSPGNALWARSLQASTDTPLKAHVVITTRSEGDAEARRSVLEMIEGTGGRFQLTYSEPADARGRVVICDGGTTWQYEPRSRTVLRRPSHESVVADDDSEAPSSWRREIEPGSVDVSGRTSQVLRILSGSGKVVERIWIDTQTGRSVRTETYDPHGDLIRSVTLSQIVVKPLVTAATFRPKIPAGARILNAEAHVASDAAAEARLLDLPSETAGFHVQSVVQTPKSSGTAAVHVLYSSGPRALSVFVMDNHMGAAKLVPPSDEEGATWKPATLSPSIHAFTQERADGQSAVAWVDDSHRYVAVSRLPLTDLLSVARALATD